MSDNGLDVTNCAVDLTPMIVAGDADDGEDTHQVFPVWDLARIA